jgi:hypothetical protein
MGKLAGIGPGAWRLGLALLAMVGVVHAPHVARAQSAASEQERLFQATLAHPQDLETTLAYARVAAANGDPEAAIGALERVLFYQPHLSRVKYELGALYFRLRSFEMARRYFREALASPDLDPVTRSRIEAALPDADKQMQASRFSVFLQTGIRSQSNATFAPNAGVVRFGGQDLALLPAAQRRSDVNWFGLAGVSHDYDLDAASGTTLETRFAGYVSEQARFRDLNVGLFDLSFGPRFALLPELLPGATIKPYVTGGNTWVGGASYLASYGAGVTASIPFLQRFTLTPEIEWRRADIKAGDLAATSAFNSGNWVTAGLGLAVDLNADLRLESRGAFRHGDAAFAFSSFDQWVAEASLTWWFAPPSDAIPRNWSLSPFVRLIKTDFKAPNPAIDPAITRHDTEWIAGMRLDSPLTASFGLSTVVQYNRTQSNLSNYSLDNWSVMFGPTARF